MKKIIATVIAIATASIIAAGSAFAINMNTSTAAELDASDLMRVGPAIAKRIVDERTLNGDFKDATDLQTRVSGIGVKFLETNGDKMEFDATATPAETTLKSEAPAPAPAVTPAQ